MSATDHLTTLLNAAPLIDAERESAVLSAIFRSVERMPRLEAQTLMREAVAAAPADLMGDEANLRIWSWVKAQVAQNQLPAIRSAIGAPELAGISKATWEKAATPSVGALNLSFEIRVLSETAARRQAIWQLSAALEALQSGAPVAPTVNETVQVLSGVSAAEVGSRPAEHYADALETDAAAESGKTPAAVSLGIPSADRLLERRGVVPGEMIGVVAGTGEGKTRLAQGAVIRALQDGVGVTYCSTEQGETDTWVADDGQVMVGHRTVASLERLAYGVGRTFRKTESSRRRSRAGRELIVGHNADGHALLHVKSDSMAIEALEREGVRAALRGHRLMVIDNLEHVHGRRVRGDSNHNYIERICHDLAAIASKNKLVVMVLMQPNREGIKSDMPAELDQIAGSIDATRPFDLIISLWRPSKLQKDGYKRSMESAHTETDVVRCLQHGAPHLVMGKLVNGLASFVKVRSGGFGGLLELGWDEHVGRWHDLGDSAQPLPPHWQAEQAEAERRAASFDAAPAFQGDL